MPQPLALIIEDQHNLATLYEDALRLVGFNVSAKHDGLEALNHLAMNPAPDFVILDVNLPRLSGREILKHIRGSDKYAQMPVLILTANSLMIEQIRPTLTENDYLHVKPISMLELQDLAKKVRADINQRLANIAETQATPVINDEEQIETIGASAKDISTKENERETVEHQAILTDDEEIENEDEAT
ncbi:MAG: hypothetical protein Phog2KO_47220 [Phototrophicaceae bacterium]